MVPIIAFRHYAIRDFPPNCAELIRGLPAASPPSLLLASVSTRGEGRISPVAGKLDRSKYRKIFLQGRQAVSSLADAAGYQLPQRKRHFPNPALAELLTKGTGESSSTAPYGSMPH
jgi:hypothetical protein